MPPDYMGSIDSFLRALEQISAFYISNKFP